MATDSSQSTTIPSCFSIPIKEKLSKTNSSQSTTIPSCFSIPIKEKLSKMNYHLWWAQIMPPIHATQMEDLLLGIEKMSTKTVLV
jgi:hypothetical protein